MSTSGLKRSDSKDDASSSLRDSGISISEELSESEPESSKSLGNKKKARRSNTGKNYECAVCGKKFGGSTDLRRHLLIHSDEKPYTCVICQKSYRQEVNLKNHMKIAHTNQREFMCSFCRRPFPLKQRLKFHLRIHTGEKPYSCPKCAKTFARGGQLQQHLATHDKISKKSSDTCRSTFSNEKNLRLHMERHEDECSNKCQICNELFSTEKSMRVHLKLKHAKIKEFKCQLCDKTVKDDMEKHMKLHTPAKPFECEICKAAFAQKGQYNIHQRTHTGERPYQCRVCWQNFGHSSVLKLHIRKHTGEKPFKCLLCQDSYIAFSQLSHLKTHMKAIHQQDKAYACEGCKECFKVKFQLETHMQLCEKIPSANKSDSFDNVVRSKEDIDAMARIRYLMAVLLKKISTEEKLTQLGFEKRLIDNVIIASLKLANQKCYDNKKMDEFDQLKLNIQSFLEWMIPEHIMKIFKKDCPSIESILDKIVTMYLKKIKQ